MSVRRIHCAADVLVIGGGCAGLAAAAEAAKLGANVLVLSKSPAGQRNCSAHAAGYITYCDADAKEELFRQVVAVGGFLNNQKLVDAFVSDAAAITGALRECGVALELPEESETRGGTRPALQTLVPGTAKPIGLAMTLPMRKHAEALGAAFLDGVVVGDLVMSDGGGVVGCVGVDTDNEILVSVSSKATILASGGGACIYARSDNPRGLTGDGFALAYRAGAELVDMEFVSFQLGGDDVRRVFEVASPPDPALLTRGSAHYFLGGVKINERCRSTVPRLFAAGEVTGGVFGAARLGGSALADALVFGWKAGRVAAQSVGPGASPDRDLYDRAIAQLADRVGSSSVQSGELLADVRQTMWSLVGTMKTGDTLSAALDGLRSLADQVEAARAPSVAELGDRLEARSAYEVALLVTTASTLREESRGCFWRIDHPEPNNERCYMNIVLHNEHGSLGHRAEPVITTKICQPGAPLIGAGCFDYLELHG